MEASVKVVTLTDLAVNRVKEFMAKQTQKTSSGLRIYVMPGGCSGYQYGMVLESKATPDDIVWSEKGIKVFVDRDSAELLRGSTVDYVETLQGSGFKINNPNAVSSCGCGNSFEAGHSHGEEEHELEGGGCSCGCGGH
jgi:iron-sulfur cluster assembly protein